jgi:hypothetical protein
MGNLMGSLLQRPLISYKSKPFVFFYPVLRTNFERAKLTQPFSFLLKPFNELEILYAIEMAVRSLCPNQCFLSEDKDTVISAEYLFVKKINL